MSPIYICYEKKYHTPKDIPEQEPKSTARMNQTAN
jgi:hypothetical protein